MRKSEYKRVPRSASDYTADRLRHKGVFCISTKWFRWAKRNLNRTYRRKNKQQIKNESVV